MLSLRFCARTFSSCGKWGPLFIAVRGPLTIAASLVAEHRLQTRRLSSCGSRAQPLRDMWNLPRPGLEPVSPALAGGFSTTAPPGKPPMWDFLKLDGFVEILSSQVLKYKFKFTILKTKKLYKLVYSLHCISWKWLYLFFEHWDSNRNSIPPLASWRSDII